ncbi:serine carboxypeptidase-like 15, partial [Curcuma longa]|uniref:serine carboxypeptidase-like 15 n=1 Tax=Curcuma longa TaxID=136217 RepID=UPI003D9F09E7
MRLEHLFIDATLPFKRTILSLQGFFISNGDHDLVVPFSRIKQWIKSLSSSMVEDWRSWHIGAQVAGYVEVDKENCSQLFYYFIESENKPAEDPLLVWLTGGPMCSAFSDLVFEIDGHPKIYDNLVQRELAKLVYHPYSWTK